MKTKTVKYYVTLQPHWHNNDFKPVVFNAPSPSDYPGSKVFEVQVELPCFPIPDEIAGATVKEFKP